MDGKIKISVADICFYPLLPIHYFMISQIYLTTPQRVSISMLGTSGRCKNDRRLQTILNSNAVIHRWNAPWLFPSEISNVCILDCATSPPPHRQGVGSLSVCQDNAPLSGRGRNLSSYWSRLEDATHRTSYGNAVSLVTGTGCVWGENTLTGRDGPSTASARHHSIYNLL